MNLLNSIFNYERIEIMEVNNKNMLIMLLVLMIIFSILFLVKKDYYYTNTLTKVGDNYVMIIDNNMLEQIENKSKLIMENKEIKFSINKKELLEKTGFLYVDLDNNVDSINSNYKILLGKETLFEYLIRIIKK